MLQTRLSTSGGNAHTARALCACVCVCVCVCVFMRTIPVARGNKNVPEVVFHAAVHTVVHAQFAVLP
eukprot:COSAG03_NODE_828_length_5708_cov_537.017828_5_plen_67_part_00